MFLGSVSVYPYVIDVLFSKVEKSEKYYLYINLFRKH